MYPNNPSGQYGVPNVNPVPGSSPAASDHRATVGASYSGHTIGTIDSPGQMMPSAPEAFAQAGGQPQRFINTTAAQAGLQAYEHKPDVFTTAQWQGIRTVLGGPMQGSLWLAYRLAELSNYELDFIVDNSLSMNQRDGMLNPETGRSMSRLEEAIYRLSNIADLLSYIPVKGITLRNLADNHAPAIINCQAAPQEISSQIKNYLDHVYCSARTSNTPLYTALHTSLSENRRSSNPRIIYVLNDGEPNRGGTAADVCSLLQSGRTYEKNPVCLIACTDERQSIGWMENADNIDRVHVVDDYESEKKSIHAKQGRDFPVTEGFYAMSSLLGAIDDLFDKADENHIYSHNQYQEIMGRQVPAMEYENYRRNAQRLQEQSGAFGGGNYLTTGASYFGQYLGFR